MLRRIGRKLAMKSISATAAGYCLGAYGIHDQDPSGSAWRYPRTRGSRRSTHRIDRLVHLTYRISKIRSKFAWIEDTREGASAFLPHHY
jgi:hypothetical protein